MNLSHSDWCPVKWGNLGMTYTCAEERLHERVQVEDHVNWRTVVIAVIQVKECQDAHNLMDAKKKRERFPCLFEREYDPADTLIWSIEL